MSNFGLKITDDSDIVEMDVDFLNIAKANQALMPQSLVDTDKYYAKINLPNNDSINIDRINLVSNGFLFNVKLSVSAFTDGTKYWASFFMSPYYNKYTKNLSTGAMTSWTCGTTLDDSVDSNWSLLTSIYPEVYFDKLSDTSSNHVKIFAAMRYHCYDASASSFIDAYIFGRNGIEKVDYGIICNNKEEN